MKGDKFLLVTLRHYTSGGRELMRAERHFSLRNAEYRFEKNKHSSKNNAVALFQELPSGALLLIKQSGSIFEVDQCKLG